MIEGVYSLTVATACIDLSAAEHAVAAAAAAVVVAVAEPKSRYLHRDNNYCEAWRLALGPSDLRRELGDGAGR